MVDVEGTFLVFADEVYEAYLRAAAELNGAPGLARVSEEAILAAADLVRTRVLDTVKTETMPILVAGIIKERD